MQGPWVGGDCMLGGGTSSTNLLQATDPTIIEDQAHLIGIDY